MIAQPTPPEDVEIGDPDDVGPIDGLLPEHAERRDRVRAAKYAKYAQGQFAGLRGDELAAVAEGRDPEAAPTRRQGGAHAKGFEARRSRPPYDRKKCLYCRKPINAFSGECLHCKEPNPGRPDTKSIQLRDRDRKSDDVRTECLSCGNALHVNGRCYRCKPGGRNAGADRAKTRAQTAKAEPKPAISPDAEPAISPDAELATIASILDTIARLEPNAQARSIPYLISRLADMNNDARPEGATR